MMIQLSQFETAFLFKWLAMNSKAYLSNFLYLLINLNKYEKKSLFFLNTFAA